MYQSDTYQSLRKHLVSMFEHGSVCASDTGSASCLTDIAGWDQHSIITWTLDHPCSYTFDRNMLCSRNVQRMQGHFRTSTKDVSRQAWVRGYRRVRAITVDESVIHTVFAIMPEPAEISGVALLAQPVSGTNLPKGILSPLARGAQPRTPAAEPFESCPAKTIGPPLNE